MYRCHGIFLGDGTKLLAAQGPSAQAQNRKVLSCVAKLLVTHTKHSSFNYFCVKLET